MEKKENQICSITLKCSHELLPWSITHYCSTTISNFMKLNTLLSMVDYINQGIPLENFCIDIYPKNLYEFEMESYSEEQIKDRRILFDTKSVDENKFWKYFYNKERPNVLVKIQNTWYPLYDDKSREAFKIKKIEVNSPAKFTFEGLGESINSLRFGKDREIRNTRDSEIEQLGKLIDIQTKLDNSSMLPEHKKVMQAKIDLILNNQKELNDKTGISEVEIKHVDYYA